MTRPPMPPGYQGTIPLLAEEERQAIRYAMAVMTAAPPPPIGWWQDHMERIVAAFTSAKDGGRL